jgi:broad specificity phosphatase PhoE
MSRILVILGLALCLAPLPLWAADPAADKPVTVFFIRHAEKDQDGTRDPALSDKGRQRAVRLAGQLAQAGVTHLYATQFKRTQQTLGPLAEQTGVEVTVVQAQEPGEQLRVLRELPQGSLAVVAGHSNTMPGLVCDLGGRPADLDCGESGRALDEKEYDRLYLLLLPPPDAADRSPLRTLSLRYGD